MHATLTKRIIGALVAGLVVAGAVWFAWPQPIAVDIATVVKGPMEVTVDDEGKTRVRHVYTVSAPLAGKVLRTSRHVGDQVIADETVVAVMQPTQPAFHDVRTHEELQAALAAAEAAVRFAEAEVRRIEAALAFARTELERAQKLARTDAISLKALDKAKFDVETNEAALASAKAQLDVRRYERASAAAQARFASACERFLGRSVPALPALPRDASCAHAGDRAWLRMWEGADTEFGRAALWLGRAVGDVLRGESAGSAESDFRRCAVA